MASTVWVWFCLFVLMGNWGNLGEFMKTLHCKKKSYVPFENIAFQKSFIPNLDSLTRVSVFGTCILLCCAVYGLN